MTMDNVDWDSVEREIRNQSQIDQQDSRLLLFDIQAQGLITVLHHMDTVDRKLTIHAFLDQLKAKFCLSCGSCWAEKCDCAKKK